MKHLKLFEDYIVEGSHSLDNESIEIDGYIIHDDDIIDIFSELYKDVPQLAKSEISMEDVTKSNHPHIRGFVKVPKTESQFRVTFFMHRKDTDGTDFNNRFYQYYDKKDKPLLNSEILDAISRKMFNRYGYVLSNSATLSYDDRITGGNKQGYCLDFYFSKYK